MTEVTTDAGAPDAIAVTPDAAPLPPTDAPPPTFWIGGHCTAPTDCPFEDGMCLTEGFPDGVCTRECTQLCPDRAGLPITLCIDGRPFGFDQGLCVSRCDPQVGCGAGWQCTRRTRFADPDLVEDVCVPSPPPDDCQGVDELIDIDYPDRGKLWIPAEAQCGGAFPLVVMLHGINPGMNPTPSLGGGRRLEILVRSLIDAGAMKPVILAEPVQLEGAASSTGLYSPTYFDPATHLDQVEAELTHHDVTVSTLSYTGHSGSGCDSHNGLYLILDRIDELVPTYATRLLLWGTEDICYGGDFNWQAPLGVLAGQQVAVMNMTSTGGDPGAFEAGLLGDDAVDLPCPSSLYAGCRRRADGESWCSYRTAGVSHDLNPYYFVREAFPRLFAGTGSTICR